MAEPKHNTGTEVPGEHKGAFPPFQSQTFASQLVWLTIAFVLLYVLMWKLALPRVAKIIDNRQKRIEDDIADAGKLKTQSDEAVAAYEKALADARARAQTIAATKTAAMLKVRSIAEDATRAIVERLIGEAPSDKAVADAVAGVLKN